MSNLPLLGGCSCGALRYEVRAAPFMVYNCHCTNCQKISGSAFNISVSVSEASFEFTAGEPVSITWRSDAGNLRSGLLCRACGSRIANAMSPSNGVLSLRGGTLDDPGWLDPVGDIWVKSKQPWVTIPARRIQFERGPTDYAPFIERFKEQDRF